MELQRGGGGLQLIELLHKGSVTNGATLSTLLPCILHSGIYTKLPPKSACCGADLYCDGWIGLMANQDRQKVILPAQSI